MGFFDVNWAKQNKRLNAAAKYSMKLSLNFDRLRSFVSKMKYHIDMVRREGKDTIEADAIEELNRLSGVMNSFINTANNLRAYFTRLRSFIMDILNQKRRVDLVKRNFERKKRELEIMRDKRLLYARRLRRSSDMAGRKIAALELKGIGEELRSLRSEMSTEIGDYKKEVKDLKVLKRQFKAEHKLTKALIETLKKSIKDYMVLATALRKRSDLGKYVGSELNSEELMRDLRVLNRNLSKHIWP